MNPSQPASTSGAGEAPEFNNTGVGPLKVPGLGLEHTYEVALKPGAVWTHAFAHGAGAWQQRHRLTVKEVAMLNVMDSLTDKPDWAEKVFNEDIVSKWRQEASQMEDMSEKAFEWCLQELRDKAAFYKEKNYMTTLETGSRAVKSDTLVPEALRQELIQNVQQLLDGPKKDYHPNSDDKVLNLVHPSLYPLVYGRTPVLREGTVGLLTALQSCGRGEIAPTLEDPSSDPESPPNFRYHESSGKHKLWSHEYQWLPAEVRFKGDEGTNVEFTSYINNLHPNLCQPLYATIEKILSLAIRPWNDILIRRAGRTPLRILTWGATWNKVEPDWMNSCPTERTDGNADRFDEYVADVKAYLAIPDDAPEDVDSVESRLAPDFPDNDWADETEMWQLCHWKSRRLRKVIHPDPGESFSYDDWKAGRTSNPVIDGTSYGQRAKKGHAYYDINLEREFRSQGLQVIVKLSSIELTPDKPKYDGGSWHIEGKLNEHIVATAIYYYDVHNVTTSRISFRQDTNFDNMDLQYEQDDHGPLEELFGLDSLREVLPIQEIGSVATPGGRFLAFPNTLQHCVSSFSLLDKTQPGHRRFLVLWLVDPNYRILSTANVPPQQHKWAVEDQFRIAQVTHKLPRELADMVLEEASRDMMTEEEAKAIRLRLMQDRTSVMDAIEDHMEMYNFCEH